jgi:glyoxylase-like metal-dependent hydrolase (beta-lactamase superfamily II)
LRTISRRCETGYCRSWREGFRRIPFGDGDQILGSIHDKYFALPDETVVVPGHGPVTTLGREKQFNYFLQGM